MSRGGDLKHDLANRAQPVYAGLSLSLISSMARPKGKPFFHPREGCWTGQVQTMGQEKVSAGGGEKLGTWG